MTKLTEMNSTQRRNVARSHRVEAAVIKTQMESMKGFTPSYAKLKTLEVFPQRSGQALGSRCGSGRGYRLRPSDLRQ